MTEDSIIGNLKTIIGNLENWQKDLNKTEQELDQLENELNDKERSLNEAEKKQMQDDVRKQLECFEELVKRYEEEYEKGNSGFEGKKDEVLQRARQLMDKSENEEENLRDIREQPQSLSDLIYALACCERRLNSLEAKVV